MEAGATIAKETPGGDALRVQIWRLAADPALTEAELIQRVLDVVGPATGVARASFYRREPPDVVCRIEWRRPDLASALGNRIPWWMIEALRDAAHVEMGPAELVDRLPAARRAEARAAIGPAYLRLGVVSAFAVPFGLAGELEGILSLQHCAPVPPGWSEPLGPLVADLVQIVTQTIARARTDAALRGSERRFRELVDLLPVAIVEADPGGRIRFMNRSGREMTGFTADAVAAGLSFADFVAPEERPRLMDGLATAARVRGLRGARYAAVRPDGERYAVEVHTQPLHADGAFVGVRGVAIDITAREAAVQALRASEAAFRALFETARDAIVILAPDSTILAANAAACQQVAEPHDALVGRRLLDFIPPEHQPTATRNIARPPGELITGFHLRRDGSRVPVELTLAPIEFHGQPASVEISRDVTERARGEQALRESEQRFRELADLLPQIVFECDAAGVVTFANRLALGVLGVLGVAQGTPERPLRLTEFVVPEDRERLAADFTRALHGTSTPGQEYRVAGADGALRDLVAYTSPIVRGGAPAGLRGVAIDVTDQKRAAAERLRLEAKMHEAQKLESLGLLAGGIAHDFNNLLVGILGNAELAQRDLARSPSAVRRLERIKRSAQRASELATQMLAYSGKGQVLVEPLDLSATVQEMSELLLSAVTQRGVLRLALCPTLPRIEADVTQIRQVVMNLILNAVDALGDEAGVVTLSTGVTAVDARTLADAWGAEDASPGRFVFVEVVDTGCGMDEATQGRVFEPFFTTKFTGRGLGLAAVLGIVRRHQGAITVTSAPGRGTTFRVLLPAVGPPTATVAPPAAVPADWRGRGTVLVVDDEEDVREVGSDMLRVLGFAVRTATSGAEAIRLVEGHGAELVLVLLDLTMPRMTGEETFARLRQLAPDLPVIVASGYAEQDVASRFAAVRPQGHVQKPFGLETLAQKLREVLGDGPGAR